MPEKYSVENFPTADQLAVASRRNRYNIEIDELDEATARRLKRFCDDRKLIARIDSDQLQGQYKISIFDVNLAVIEQIEGVLTE